MAYGLMTKNADGSLDGLSSEANTLVFLKKLSSSSSAGYSESLGNSSGLLLDYQAKISKYEFTSPGEPIIFAAQSTIDDAVETPSRILGVEKGTGDNYTLWIQYPYNHTNQADYNEYYVFVQISQDFINNNTPDSFGMRMWDSGNNVTFDSSYKPLIFKGSVSLPSLTVGSGGDATYSGSMTKPAYLLRTNPACYSVAGYGPLSTCSFGCNIAIGVQHLNVYRWLKENNKMHVQWYTSAQAQSSYYYNGNFNTAFGEAIDSLNSNCIDIDHNGAGSATSSWTNISFGGEYMPMIDGADYD